MMLMGVGWQLGTAMPASADQRDEPLISQSQSMNDETDQVEIGPITDQSTPTTDDDGDVVETTQELVTTALTPNTPVDQPAIARAADQVTSAPEVGDEPTQSGKLSTDESTAAVVPTDIPVSTEPAPDQSAPVMAYDDRTIDEWMPNPILQKVILWTLKRGDPNQVKFHPDNRNWKTVDDITQQDMSLLLNVSIIGDSNSDGISTYISEKTSGKTEFSLKGLEYAANMTNIALGGGGREFPYHLQGDVVDISQLAYMPNLNSALLSFNRIEDISPLRNLKNLGTLHLAYNHIADFRVISGLNSNMKLYLEEQYVVLPSVKVDVKTRSHHLLSPFRLPNGNTPGLSGFLGDLWQDFIYDINDEDTNYHLVYHTLLRKNFAWVKGEKGMWFKDIPDQQPGKLDPFDNHQIESLDNKYYYLVSQANVLKKDVEPVDSACELEPEKFDCSAYWYVIQPYTIGQAAGTVTVHYQDQSGKTIAPDKKLAQGFVDDDYDAKDLAVNIEGYTLQEPLPDNAKGKYTEGPIEITYIYQQDQVKPGGTQPPVSGVTPPVPTPVPSTPVVTPPASSEKPAPAPVPPVTAPTEMVRPETPKPAVTPEPVVHQAGAASAVAPVTPVDHGGVSDAVAVALPVSQQQTDSNGSAPEQPILPQTNQRQGQLAWLGGWGLLVGIVGVIWHRRKRE